MVDHSMQSSPRNSRRWLFGLLVLLVIAGLCWKFWPTGAPHPEAPAGRTGKTGMARPGFGGSTGPVPVRVAPAVLGSSRCTTRHWGRSPRSTLLMYAAGWARVGEDRL